MPLAYLRECLSFGGASSVAARVGWLAQVHHRPPTETTQRKSKTESIPVPSWFLHWRGTGESRPSLSGEAERRPGSSAMAKQELSRYVAVVLVHCRCGFRASGGGECPGWATGRPWGGGVG